VLGLRFSYVLITFWVNFIIAKYIYSFIRQAWSEVKINTPSLVKIIIHNFALLFNIGFFHRSRFVGIISQYVIVLYFSCVPLKPRGLA